MLSVLSMHSLLAVLSLCTLTPPSALLPRGFSIGKKREIKVDNLSISDQKGTINDQKQANYKRGEGGVDEA